MKKLRITFIVGTGFRKDGSPISSGARHCMANRAEQFFLKTCGGYNFTNGSGGWREVDPTRGKVSTRDWQETNIVYTVLVDAGTVAVKPLAEWVRDNFEQKCIVVTTETVDCDFI